MGGNALSVGSVRLARPGYERLASEVVAILAQAFPGKRTYAIEAYRAKADFGDLDVLVDSTDFDPHRATQALGAVEVVRNGPVTSIGVRIDSARPALEGNVFQVDLITIGPESFDFASHYFRNNDAGNLLGRISHAMSIALRHDGLVYAYRDGDYRFRDIVLTRDWGEALAFLGYDPARYTQGFDDLESIFRYVASTPFFNPEIFLLENRNARARVRDRKRPTYNAFLAWCDSRPDLPRFEFPENKAAWLPRIVEFFPRFQAEHDKATADLSRQRELKARFHGEFVARATGLEGKALGEAMRRIKDSFETPEAMHDFVLASDDGVLAERVLRVLAEPDARPRLASGEPGESAGSDEASAAVARRRAP